MKLLSSIAVNTMIVYPICLFLCLMMGFNESVLVCMAIIPLALALAFD